MVKKIIFILVSVAIIAGGYIAFGKLSYWERSVRIFRMDNQAFSGRQGRGFEERGDFRGGRGEARPDFRQLPDSVRRRFGQDERFQNAGRMRAGEMPDSLRRSLADGRFRGNGISQDSLRGVPGRIEAGFRGGEGRRGDFRGGKKVNLQSVGWFLAVFAGFTVITICLDRLYRFIRLKKQ